MLNIVLEVLRYAGLTTLPFALYFFWMKLGYRVAASYTWSFGVLRASGLSNVTLINMKDRPMAIFGIHGVMDGLSFHLKEFNPPLILKALEAVSIDIDPVSKRWIGQESYDWKPPANKASNVDIYLSTSFKTIKCRREGPPSHIGFALARKLRVVTSQTTKFNDVIYNDNARFAVTYVEGDQEKTAIIDKAGVIHWRLAPNGLRPQDLHDAKTVRAAIVASGLDRLISPFAVDDLQEREQAQKNHEDRRSANTRCDGSNRAAPIAKLP